MNSSKKYIIHSYVLLHSFGYSMNIHQFILFFKYIFYFHALFVFYTPKMILFCAKDSIFT